MPTSLRDRHPLKGLKFAVVAFNARPIACSLKRAGATVLVSDYWADDDLPDCCDDWIALLKPIPGRRQRGSGDGRPPDVGLVENLVTHCAGKELDAVLVGSGLDNSPSQIEILERGLPLTGNDADAFRRARDRVRVSRLADSTGLRFPLSVSLSSSSEAASAALQVGYPCVLKPAESGGGAGIRLVRTERDLLRCLRPLDPQRFYVQQYIRGMDVSCSVLATGSEAVALSVQGQLIGTPSAGRCCDFSYCGNFAPLSLRTPIVDTIMNASETICRELGLKGSNGLDFVVDEQGSIWLMEINPRLQGSLEMLELASGESVTTLHYGACAGDLPEGRLQIRPTVRMIVFATKTGFVGDIRPLGHVADITPAGVGVLKGDPVCTVLETGKTMAQCYSDCFDTARRVQVTIAPARL